MSERESNDQSNMWIVRDSIQKSPGHPFYAALNGLFREHGFDRFVEDSCRKFYAEKNGRPSIAPGIYFRMLFVGFFEKIDSERGIEWRCCDSLSLREFLGLELDERVPDHSSLSRIRNRIDLETHDAVFSWMLKLLAEHGLVKGRSIGIDSTTLEANAAMRSIVRRDTGESYREFLERIAKESGIETPTAEDLAKIDRKRKKKASNDDWTHPHDPDAAVAKMKDGSTHMAHKDERAVDLNTGAILAVNVCDAGSGDHATGLETLVKAKDAICDITRDGAASEGLSKDVLRDLVADKGYHSDKNLMAAELLGMRSYIPEPERNRNWNLHHDNVKRRCMSNRRRARGNRGKNLRKKRSELVERSFANTLDKGGMRRVHLRGREKIAKRLLIHIAGYNLSILMRKVFGIGMPKMLQDSVGEGIGLLFGCITALSVVLRSISAHALSTIRFYVPDRRLEGNPLPSAF